MAGDVNNPRVWSDINVYKAPLGTTLPTDVTTALNAAFKLVGLLTTDGITESRDGNQTDHFAHGSVLVRRTMSQEVRSFAFTPVEDKPVTFEMTNPGSTTSTAGGLNTRVVKKWTSAPAAYVIEYKDASYTMRQVVTRGEAIGSGDITRNEDTLTGIEITVAVFPNATTGEFYTELSNAPGAISTP